MNSTYEDRIHIVDQLNQRQEQRKNVNISHDYRSLLNGSILYNEFNADIDNSLLIETGYSNTAGILGKQR